MEVGQWSVGIACPDRQRIRGDVGHGAHVGAAGRGRRRAHGHDGADHGWYRTAVREPYVRDADVDGLPSYPFAQWGLTDSNGQPAGYVRDVLDHYIIPNLPGAMMASPPRWCGTNEIWPFIGSRTFDASSRPAPRS